MSSALMLVVRWVLGIYAGLLMVGGLAGFLKARSRASLIAGLISGLFVIVCLVLNLAYPPTGGLVLASIIAVGLALLFAIRFIKGRKFMPAGLILIVSLVSLVVFLAAQIGWGR